MRDNADDMKDLYKEVDSTTIFQIIENAKTVDTLYWTDNELDKFILIQNREQGIQFRQALQKFKLVGKKKLRYYRKLIAQFYKIAPADRDIYYLSKPVFDSTKQFAIIQWEDGHSGLGGGGGINLYKYTGGIWRFLGNIKRWQY